MRRPEVNATLPSAVVCRRSVIGHQSAVGRQAGRSTTRRVRVTSGRPKRLNQQEYVCVDQRSTPRFRQPSYVVARSSVIGHQSAVGRQAGRSTTRRVRVTSGRPKRLNQQEIARIAQRLRRPKVNPQRATRNSTSAVCRRPCLPAGRRHPGREVNPQRATRKGTSAVVRHRSSVIGLINHSTRTFSTQRRPSRPCTCRKYMPGESAWRSMATVSPPA
jgi:hypothetical protein